MHSATLYVVTATDVGADHRQSREPIVTRLSRRNPETVPVPTPHFLLKDYAGIDIMDADGSSDRQCR
jgi:hypothetical protein